MTFNKRACSYGGLAGSTRARNGRPISDDSRDDKWRRCRWSQAAAFSEPGPGWGASSPARWGRRRGREAQTNRGAPDSSSGYHDNKQPRRQPKSRVFGGLGRMVPLKSPLCQAPRPWQRPGRLTHPPPPRGVHDRGRRGDRLATAWRPLGRARAPASHLRCAAGTLQRSSRPQACRQALAVCMYIHV